MKRSRCLLALTFAAFVLAGWILSSQSAGQSQEKTGAMQGEMTMEENAKLQVIETRDGVTVDTDMIRFELGHEGILRAMDIDDKAVVSNNDVPLLSASVLESEEYDGWSDYAPGKIIEATYQSTAHEYAHDDKEFKATYTGRLDFGGGDSIDYQVVLTASASSPFLEIATQFAHQGDFGNI